MICAKPCPQTAGAAAPKIRIMVPPPADLIQPPMEGLATHVVDSRAAHLLIMSAPSRSIRIFRLSAYAATASHATSTGVQALSGQPAARLCLFRQATPISLDHQTNCRPHHRAAAAAVTACSHGRRAGSGHCAAAGPGREHGRVGPPTGCRWPGSTRRSTALLTKPWQEALPRRPTAANKENGRPVDRPLRSCDCDQRNHILAPRAGRLNV